MEGMWGGKEQGSEACTALFSLVVRGHGFQNKSNELRGVVSFRPQSLLQRDPKNLEGSFWPSQYFSGKSFKWRGSKGIEDKYKNVIKIS